MGSVSSRKIRVCRGKSSISGNLKYSNYQKSPFSMCKSTISTGPWLQELLVSHYQRVTKSVNVYQRIVENHP